MRGFQRNIIMKSNQIYIKVSEEDSSKRLDVFLTEKLTEIPSRSLVQKLIDNGHVSVNEERVKTRYKTVVGDDVCIVIPVNFLTPRYVEPEDIPLDVVYEDEYLLVINKPIGMAVHPTRGGYSGTLVNALLQYTKNLSNINTDIRPGIVHRLDKDTSGLILVAKDNITHAKIAKQFQRREVKKTYIALVEGEIEREEGAVNVSIGRHPRYYDQRVVSSDECAKEAYTKYRVIKRCNGVSLVELLPLTGRTHQLRVHMLHLGHPVLGDKKYGRKASFERLALHSHKISFCCPKSNTIVNFCVDVPEIFYKKVKMRSL